MTSSDNPELAAARHALWETGNHVLVTGSAGTGKSTLLREFLADRPSNTVVVAPTGVAALNVGGETIHHFLRIAPAATRDDVARAATRARKGKNARLYERLETLIIDEISMVRADLFDYLDIFLRTARGRREPFGGVRLLAFGDLYQLPPVVASREAAAFGEVYETPFFFSSDVFSRLQTEWPDRLAYIELTHVYRQNDIQFIQLLQAIRQGRLAPDGLARLNDCVIAPQTLDELDPSLVVLTVTRSRASQINRERLRRLPGQARAYKASWSGKFQESAAPTDIDLQLKVGARVMLLNNDAEGRWVNGSMATLTALGEHSVRVRLDDRDGEWTVGSYTWEASQAVFDAGQGRLARETIGEFHQLPLKLAWAVTVHKAQGQTFPQLLVDLERRAFAGGQTYVALSRGTCLAGLHLARPLRPDDIHADPQVLAFQKSFRRENGRLVNDYARGRVRRAVYETGTQESIF